MSILRVRAAWSGPSAPLLSQWYFIGQPFDQVKVESAFSNVATFLNSIRDRVADDFTYSVQQEVAEIDPATGQTVDTWVSVNVANSIGTDTGDPLPFQTQGMVNYRTGLFIAGREVRGRCFIPGPTEVSSTAGVPLAAYTTDLSAAAAVQVSDPAIQLAVWSRKNSVAVEVGSASAANSWKVLRSRR